MRKTVLALLTALATSGLPGFAETRAAIIDTAFDTRPYLDQILGSEKGVMVIGRYLARCKQPQNWARNKRLIDQGTLADPRSEISEIARRGGAILSIYQFYSNDPAKFSGQNRAGEALPDASCNWAAARARSVEDEARLDVDAAISQAQQLGQPRGTAIYFGVDFHLRAGETVTRDKVLRYFAVIHQQMRAAGYKIGAYGSGYTLETLQQAVAPSGERGLIDYAWIMASRSFYRTTEQHRSLNWNLFQNQVNREWFGTYRSGTSCSWGLPIDTNVQNPYQPADIGFWRPGGGPFAVPPARTRDVFESRRFICDGNATLRNSETSKADDVTQKRICLEGKHQSIGTVIPFATSVRVGRPNATGHTLQVDTDGDGTWDGWTWHGNLTRDFIDKPAWVGASQHKGLTCPKG
ncbi:MAG: glycoside hydrolase domain-containing protein [Pseudomonadota bacterium]